MIPWYVNQKKSARAFLSGSPVAVLVVLGPLRIDIVSVFAAITLGRPKLPPLLALLVLHIAGALKHQFVDRQRELARMGIGRARSDDRAF